MAAHRAFELGEALNIAETTGPKWQAAIAEAATGLDEEANAALKSARTAYASSG